MVRIQQFGLFAHLRAQSNEIVLHHRRGRLIRTGSGLAYWFRPLTAAITMVPADDGETTFMLQDRTADLQDVNVQCTVRYRVVDPERVAARVNFSIALTNGMWNENPLERLATFLAHRTDRRARDVLIGMPVARAIQAGATELQHALEAALFEDEQITDMGLAIVSVQVVNVAPSAEVEKALQTPTRELIQQKADEAVFQRRALAVENERAIKENEMSTEIELAKRHEQLIEQEGANKLREARQNAEAEAESTRGVVERETISAEGDAANTRTRAEASADAKRLVNDTTLDFEARSFETWAATPPHVLQAMALKNLAENLPDVEHLNITPDLLGQLVQNFMLNKGVAS